MSPIAPDPLPRAVPDLVPAEPDQGAPLVPPRTPQLMVRRTDGTWQSCRVIAWQRAGDRWLVHLAWGERGQIRDGWYRHDPDRAVSWPPEDPHAAAST